MQGSTVSQERSFASLDPCFTPGFVAALGACRHRRAVPHFNGNIAYSDIGKPRIGLRIEISAQFLLLCLFRNRFEDESSPTLGMFANMPAARPI